MRKSKKKLMCTILAMLMTASYAAALSGCQSNSSTSTDKASSVSSQPVAEDEDSIHSSFNDPQESSEPESSKEESSKQESSKEESSKQEPSKQEPSKQESSKEEPSKKESSSALSKVVTPEFKEAMDSYEDFFDEYVDFMKRYSKSDDALSMLTEYNDYMKKYTETIQKLDEIDEDELSDADLAYYIDVQAHISKKLLEISDVT